MHDDNPLAPFNSKAILKAFSDVVSLKTELGNKSHHSSGTGKIRKKFAKLQAIASPVKIPVRYYKLVAKL